MSKSKNKNMKRLISFVLAFVMVCSLIPFTAFATEFTAQTFTVVDWKNPVSSDTDSVEAKNIWCQFDSANGFGWGAFQPESEACIKLVKAGKTESDAVNIGIIGQNAFINEGDSYCRVRYSQYWMNLLGVGDIGLPAGGDYIIVEGKFISGDNTITVPKTYIKLTANGDNLVASSTAEQPEELKDQPAAIQAGHMTEGQGTINGNSCLFFTVTGSAIPAGSYKAVSESVIKIIRGDQEYNAAVQGRGTVLQSDGSSTYLELGGLENEWFLSPYVVAGDILVVEGNFTNGTNTVHIDKSVIIIDENRSNVTFATSLPSPAIQAGHMTEGQGTINGNSCLFFTVTGSAIPAGSYKAVSESVIKIIRGDQEYNAAVQGRGTVLQSDGSSTYLELGGLENEWFLSPYVVAGDILVVEGNFTNGTDTVTIDRSVIIIDENRTNVTFATSLPSPAIQAGHMTEGQGTINANSCLFFTVTGSAIPAGSYKAVSESVIKIIRGDQEYNAAVQGRGAVLQSDGSSTYLELGGLENEWFLSPYVVAGDILVVEGNFTNGTDTVTIDRSVIIIDENRANVTFATEIPTEPDLLEAGTMKGNSENAVLNNGGFYFTMDANELPYTDDWNTRYSPVNADVIKLVRDGETTSVGIPERTIFVKYGENAYYLDSGNGWFMNNAPLTGGDMLIVEGQFTNGTVTFHVSKSVIIVAEDGSLTFATEVPVTIPSGTLSSHANGLNYGGGIYFTMAETTAPSNEDWSVLYMPMNAACVQVIRNGETFNVGNTGAGTIVKVSNDMYYLKTEAWMNSKAPIVPGDIVVVQGRFVQSGGDAIIKVEKTYISVNWDGSLTYSTTEPSASVKPFSDTQSYTIGVWAGSFHRFGLKHFYDLRMAGINQIVGVSSYWQGSSDAERNANMNNLLDMAALYGVTVVPTLDNSDTYTCWDGTFVPGYNTQHAAIAGFLIQDEPSSSDLDSFGTLKSAFDSKTEFAGKEFFVNLYPESTSNINTGDYNAYVEKLSSIPGVNILSTDIYPVNSNGRARTSFYHNLALLASKGKSLSYTYLTAAHDMTGFSYALPDQNMLRWQMDVGLTFGARSLNQYLYSSHDTNYNCIADADTGLVINQDLYNDVAAVDNDHLAWLGEYNGYIWKGVNYVNKNGNEMLSKMSSLVTDMSGYGISTIDSTQDILIGMFQNGTQNAYMFTNAGKTSAYVLSSEWNGFSMSDATVTLTLDGSVVALKVISKGVTNELQPNADGSYTVPVSAYEGVFVIPVIGQEPAEPSSPVEQWNIILKDDLGVNFHMNLSETNQVQVKVGEETVTYNAADLDKTEDGKYIVTVSMAAAQMMDEIAIQVVGSGADPEIYTIRQYADTVLADNTKSAYHALVKEMLNYGAMAQVYFDHNGANLANADITGFGTAEVTEAAYETTIYEGAVEGIRFHAASLVYGSKVAVRLYFEVLSGTIEDYTFSTVLPDAENGIEANVLTPVAKGDYYYIEFADITPDNWSESVNLYVIKGEQNIHVQYSPLSYMVRMYSKATSGENLKNLLNAMYNYHLAAKAFTA